MSNIAWSGEDTLQQKAVISNVLGTVEFAEGLLFKSSLLSPG